MQREYGDWVERKYKSIKFMKNIRQERCWYKLFSKNTPSELYLRHCEKRHQVITFLCAMKIMSNKITSWLKISIREIKQSLKKQQVWNGAKVAMNLYLHFCIPIWGWVLNFIYFDKLLPHWSFLIKNKSELGGNSSLWCPKVGD